jgi:uncharacterized membrane protein
VRQVLADEYRRKAEEADAMARNCRDAAARTIYEDVARRLREAAERADRGGARFAELCGSLFGMGKYILTAILIALLGLTLWWTVWAWNAEGDVAMSGHGYAVMTLGITFSLVVGIGLMTLVFYSARKGYDRPAERERRDN